LAPSAIKLSGRYEELSKSYQQAQQEKALLQSRYSELNTGFTWAVNMATALGVALLFIIALFLTRRRYAAPPPAPPDAPGHGEDGSSPPATRTQRGVS
jgi:hypothetical protein